VPPPGMKTQVGKAPAALMAQHPITVDVDDPEHAETVWVTHLLGHDPHDATPAPGRASGSGLKAPTVTFGAGSER